MKRVSIKIKIILLYTILFALLLAIDFVVLRTVGFRTVKTKAEADIVLFTNEVSLQLQIEDDGVYFEDDDARFTYYHDGVQFIIYNSSQSVTYGTTPSGFNSSLPVLLNQVQSVEMNGVHWLVYDTITDRGYTLRGMYNINSLDESISSTLLVAGILSPIFVLLAAIGGYLIIKKAFRPIQEIYATANVIKEHEDFSKRVMINPGKDEVHELAFMVNQMLESMESSLTREKQFSSNVSHELRTPLTVLKAESEYLYELVKTEQLKQEVSSMMKQIDFMEHIVTELLQFTRNKKWQESEMDEIDIYDLVQLTTESFKSRCEENHITLNITPPQQPLIIKCHQTMMIRAISNMISNAIKYNKPNGTISIHFEVDNKSVKIHIDDTGKGIAKEHLKMIFNPFYRGDESRTHNEDLSLGLGLAMVKEIIETNQGHIEVESILGLGTKFTISLPIKN